MAHAKKMKLAIIIPSYNEKNNLGELISKIRRYFPADKLVVVDDNSPDGSGQLVKTLQKKDEHLYLIIRKNQRGRGSAVIRGLKFAQEKFKPDIFLEMDADLSHPPEEINKLVKEFKPDTVIIGSRYVPGARILNWPTSRLWSSRLANALIRLVLGLQLKDNTNGFRVYPPRAVEYLLKHKFVSAGYINLSEISFLLKKRGFLFKEVATTFPNRIKGQSNATLKEFFDSLVNLIRIRLQVK